MPTCDCNNNNVQRFCQGVEDNLGSPHYIATQVASHLGIHACTRQFVTRMVLGQQSESEVSWFDCDDVANIEAKSSQGDHSCRSTPETKQKRAYQRPNPGHAASRWIPPCMKFTQSQYCTKIFGYLLRSLDASRLS